MNIPAGFVNVVHLFSRSLDPELMEVAIGIEGSGTIPDLLDAVATAWHDTMQPVCNSDVALQELLAVDNSGTVGVKSGINDGGSAGGDPLPQNCCMLVKKLTGLAGREGRGRMFIPFIGAGAVGPTGVIDSGSLSTYGGAASDWYDALSGIADVDGLFLFHNSATAPTPIESFAVDRMIATQRRRLRP